MGITPATEADLEDLARLHAEGFEEPWAAEALSALLNSPGVFVLKVRAASKTSGFVMARMVLDEGEILTITVAPHARGRGVAIMLMEAVMSHMLAAGVASLFLEVSEDNEAAFALYRRLGFVEVGRRPAYYARVSGAVAALVMTRNLR